ncbi:MAG: hypothetical protein JO360_13145, partial [Acidobacteria bacterium]|nr:hypothetical protein [Acidobacteriota bacterium]
MKFLQSHQHRTRFLSSMILIACTASNALAQQPTGEIPGEGIMSYILSFRMVTVILVGLLVWQVVFRQRRRKVGRPGVEPIFLPEPPKRKKRYDKAQMSSLLKASASSAGNPALVAQRLEAVPVEGAEHAEELPHESAAV